MKMEYLSDMPRSDYFQSYERSDRSSEGAAGLAFFWGPDLSGTLQGAGGLAGPASASGVAALGDMSESLGAGGADGVLSDDGRVWIIEPKRYDFSWRKR